MHACWSIQYQAQDVTLLYVYVRYGGIYVWVMLASFKLMRAQEIINWSFGVSESGMSIKNPFTCRMMSWWQDTYKVPILPWKVSLCCAWDLTLPRFPTDRQKGQEIFSEGWISFRFMEVARCLPPTQPTKNWALCWAWKMALEGCMSLYTCWLLLLFFFCIGLPCRFLHLPQNAGAVGIPLPQ